MANNNVILTKILTFCPPCGNVRSLGSLRGLKKMFVYHVAKLKILGHHIEFQKKKINLANC